MKFIVEKHEIRYGHVMFNEEPETREITKQDAIKLIERLSEGFIVWTKKERIADNKARIAKGEDVGLMDSKYHYTIKQQSK